MTYSELKHLKVLIEDDVVYEFMNQAINSDSNIIDSMDFKKIICYSFGSLMEIQKFIHELPDSVINPNDKEFMLNQVLPQSLLWNNSRLKNCWVLAPRDLKKINYNDYWDLEWVKFRELFGENGIHRFSKPVFNESETIAVLMHHKRSDITIGSVDIIVYKKVNETWTIYFKEILYDYRDWIV